MIGKPEDRLAPEGRASEQKNHTPITIPPAALEAMAKTMCPHKWEFYHPSARERYQQRARAAFVAMVEAWPGMDYQQGALVTAKYRDPSYLILPITENPDDKA